MAVPKPNTDFFEPHPHQLHFLVIGGGICGLSTAIALCRAGHRVTVIEKDEMLSEGTEGCRIAPNMYKILRDWGIEAELQKISSKPETINMLSFAGWYLGSIRWDPEVLKETRGEFGLTTYGALQTLLYRKALSSGASIRFGAKVVSLNLCSRSPSVTLACEDVIHADVLVGADGINGVTRKYITSNEGLSKEASRGAEKGDLCMFSVSIPKQSILEDPELAYLINRRNNDMFVWLGHNSAAMGFPSGEGCDFSLYVYGPDSQTRDLTSILRDAEPSLIKLARLATGFHGLSEHPTSTPLVHEYVLDRWVEGKLVVMGEAAHPLPPGSAQSCALSVEDGVVLAKLFSLPFSRCRTSVFPLYIPNLLSTFQSIRHSRCASIQLKEIGIVHYMTMPGASEAERNMRDQALRARRDAGLTVVPEAFDVFKEDVDGPGDAESEGDEYLHSELVYRVNAGNAVPAIPPDWVEITEVYGYEAEEEVEEWEVTWGRHQIDPGACMRTFDLHFAHDLITPHSTCSLHSYSSVSSSGTILSPPMESDSQSSLEFCWKHELDRSCCFLV